MSILVFGFRDTIAERVLQKLTATVTKYTLNPSLGSINEFIEKLQPGGYAHIVGLGSYSGRDQQHIRIETRCSNRFRNLPKTIQYIPIPFAFKPSGEYKLASGIGNSWCNAVSHALLKRHPEASYTFLHIPKCYDPLKASLAIDRQLQRLLKENSHP